MTNQDPFEMPEWQALRRETELVRQLIGSGVTALGKANYADQMGAYYTAFFGVSVGLERLAKLVLVADYAISNNGALPKEQVVRQFGHKLIDLANAVDAVSVRRSLELEYSRPRSIISSKILECLDAFADARRGRYANFASLDSPNLSSEEPVSKWWQVVAHEILQAHYQGKRIQQRVETNAEAISSLLSPVSSVLYTDESGAIITDMESASIRTGQTKIVQKYGRYYSLLIVRWVSDIMSVLAHDACYKHDIACFFGINEFLSTYTVGDSFLKTRKIWPLQ